MLTRWGADLLKQTSWLQEYPRPQLQRKNWLNLNGLWQYAVTPLTQGIPLSWEGEIRVPFAVESELSGVQRRVSAEQRLWYRRTFRLSDRSERTLLHFGAVDHQCAVWLNGGLAGTHTGGSTAFSIDISAYLQPNDNEIVVAVTDPSSSSDQPRGKQHVKPQSIWYTPVTGIWQTVWLEQVPKAHHIDALKVTPTESCDAVEVIAYLGRPSRDPTLAVKCTVTLQQEEIVSVIGRPNRKLILPIEDVHLWSPDMPVLYDLNIKLIRVNDPLPVDNDQQKPAQLLRETPLRGDREALLYARATPTGQVVDEVDSYFGLRQIKLGIHPVNRQPTMLLNGEPLFQLGSLDQGWWPDGLLTPPAEAAMLYELTYLKAAGFNTVRKHIKVESARYYYHCDRLGLLVWQDMPSGFLPAQFVAPNDEAEDFRHPNSSTEFEFELHEMLH